MEASVNSPPKSSGDVLALTLLAMLLTTVGSVLMFVGPVGCIMVSLPAGLLVTMLASFASRRLTAPQDEATAISHGSHRMFRAFQFLTYLLLLSIAATVWLSWNGIANPPVLQHREHYLLVEHGSMTEVSRFRYMAAAACPVVSSFFFFSILNLNSLHRALYGRDLTR